MSVQARMGVGERAIIWDRTNKHPFLPFPAPRPSAHDGKRVTVVAGLLFVPEDETPVHALSETM